jgi:hypothetical protein
MDGTAPLADGTAPRPLAGSSWLVGDLVVKPEGGPVFEWLASALAGVVSDDVRIVAPVGVHDGWSATRWVAGSADPSNWAGILAAGRAFHRAVAHLPRPSCVDLRQDPWARADRVAWGELSLRFHPLFADLARRLQRMIEPMGSPQIVHCDLAGNVLFAPGLAPAVIDISPYWRPSEYAEAVVVADALCWSGAPASLPAEAGVSVPAVARALLFRMATTDLLGVAQTAEEAERYSTVAAALGL